MFCLLSPTESPVGKQIILRFLQEQYIRADFFFHFESFKSVFEA